ncbi:MAG: phytanoyl-CoA dioxygenase family protein [Pirellulales bacterium]
MGVINHSGPRWACGIDAEYIDQRTVDWYRENGFVRIKGVLSPEDVEKYYGAALELMEQTASYRKDAVLDQRVNVWRQQTILRELTLNPRVGAIAQRLAGVPLRLWHDQLLVKPASESAATEFHQDQPYWPHGASSSSLTAWIALVDVPVERGCMSFLPGTHSLTDVPRHELEHEQGLFDLAPELRWLPRVTVPLRAGDCTFHHGRTAHYAGPNRTNEQRIAHAVIYIDANTTYTGARHVVTNPLRLTSGQALEGELFPLVADLTA